MSSSRLKLGHLKKIKNTFFRYVSMIRTFLGLQRQLVTWMPGIRRFRSLCATFSINFPLTFDISRQFVGPI